MLVLHNQFLGLSHVICAYLQAESISEKEFWDDCDPEECGAQPDQKNLGSYLNAILNAAKMAIYAIPFLSQHYLIGNPPSLGTHRLKFATSLQSAASVAIVKIQIQTAVDYDVKGKEVEVANTVVVKIVVVI